MQQALLYFLLPVKTNPEKIHLKRNGVVPINTSINAGNAYSNLFLDSSVITAYINAEGLSAETANDIRNFYNGRNFEFAWFAPDGLTEQALGLRSLYHIENLDSSKDAKLEKRLDDLLLEDSASVDAGDKQVQQTELALTQRFVERIYSSKNNFNEDITAFVPAKKETTKAKVAAAAKEESNKENKAYNALKAQLNVYSNIAEKGGWPVIADITKKIKPTERSAVIPVIKNRLRITGQYKGADTTAAYSADLVAAVNAALASFG